MSAQPPRLRQGLWASEAVSAADPAPMHGSAPEPGTERWFAERSVGELRPGDHAWLAFANTEEQERVIGDFVRDGLNTEEKVVYVTDSEPLLLPGVRRLQGAELHRVATSGQLQVLTRESACLRHGHFDPDLMMNTLEREVSIALDQGFRAVRITSDFSWAVREPHGSELMLGCESRFEATVATGTMAMAICQVDRHSCSPDELLALRNSHEVLVAANPEFDDGVLRITRTFEPHGLRLEGELDRPRHTVFKETLTSLAGAARKVHLDVAKLRFIGLDGLNLMTRHARMLPHGGELVLDNLSPDVADVIETVGWHRLPGLTKGRGRES